jgi:hypothetical protein
MGRIRASALLATMAVMLSTLVGATAASAHPGRPGHPVVHYPPPPPSLVINRGVVKIGVTVRASGHQFRAHERVTVVISYKPKWSTRSRTLRVVSVYTDRNGNFSYYLRTGGAGYVQITATGRSSHQSASASVFVIDKRKFGRSVAMRPAAFTGAAPTATAAPDKSNTNELAVVGLAVMVMTGGALVTQRTIRRRRNAA